ncbi:MAG: apolipoprotein N-acyltransferase, partial [Deltaproteobacteria bacterium]|nr:apolipoprotein N-acyltransferase [Deltaproteobacteria bacterium]
NIAQSAKWDLEFQIPTIKKYVKLSLSTKTKNPDLVVWPETATPFYFLRNKPLSEMIIQAIHDMDTDFLIGSPSFVQNNQDVEYYNSAYLNGPKGTVYGRYDKAHLVPFGEYIPFHGWLPFLNKIVEGVGDFKPGEKGKTLQWGNNRVGVQICYEIIFPALSRALVINDAGLLINITNDAWYGRSSAPYQHFSMSVFRAVENRRSLVRSANTGISGFIDPVGRVIAATPLFTDAVLTRTVPILNEKSFYTRHGDLFAMVCLVLSLMAGIFNYFRSG